MKNYQLLQLIYPAKRPLNELEGKILKICVSAIMMKKLDMLSDVLKREGYIEMLSNTD